MDPLFLKELDPLVQWQPQALGWNVWDLLWPDKGTNMRTGCQRWSQQGLTPRSQKLDGKWCGWKLGLKDTTSPYVKLYKVWSQVSRNLEAGRGNKKGKPQNANKNVRYFKSVHGGGGPHSWSGGWLAVRRGHIGDEPSPRLVLSSHCGHRFQKNSKRASPSSQVFLSLCLCHICYYPNGQSKWLRLESESVGHI